MPALISPSEYAKKLQAIRGKSLELCEPYVNARTPLKVRCLTCSDTKPWYRLPSDLLKSTACPHTKHVTKPLTDKDYKDALRTIHGGKIVSTTPYVNARTKVGHRCLECKCSKAGCTWFCLPQSILSYGRGCKTQGYQKRRDQSGERIKALALTFNLEMLGPFKGPDCPTKFQCLTCENIEERNPRAFLNKRGGKPKICTACYNRTKPVAYSKMAIEWLEKLSRHQKIFIQHAGNLGEFIIPGTRLRADGYCKETNTIYEFHGDRFHGNLKVFNLFERCSPFSILTAKDLYAKTLQREHRIRALGYNLVVMWENDYKGRL